LVSVRALTVSYKAWDGRQTRIPALTDVNFDIPRGSAFGILGESGCGKSTLLLSMLNLLGSGAVSAGSVEFQSRNLLTESERELQRVRGARIGFIAQEAGTALNPVRKVGDQVMEVLRAHRSVSKMAARAAAITALESVSLDPERVFGAWPHQLSGGQRQRVLLAQALICGPDLLLADEPAHSLDARTRMEICRLLRQRTADSKMSLLIASHSPRVLRATTEHLFVFYAGQIIESGRTEAVLADPLHPYTRALLNCCDQESLHEKAYLASDTPRRMITIPGQPPQSNGETTGCRFVSRCVQRRRACSENRPALLPVTPTGEVRCILYD
jgi:peptide/nickel transport system ATP-binding protein